MNTGTLPYEQAAEIRTNLSGWVCKTCKRYWADDEHMARWCCASDLECGEKGCKNRIDKGYTMCTSCSGKKTVARWEALEAVEWDGKTPLVVHDDDTYFFEVEDLDRYLEDNEIKIEDVRLMICVPLGKPYFDMVDHLEDYLPEDMDCEDPKDINKTVNDWVKEHADPVWTSGNTRPTLESVKPHVTQS